MSKLLAITIKPLLHWSVLSRLVLAVSLSAVVWALVIGVSH